MAILKTFSTSIKRPAQGKAAADYFQQKAIEENRIAPDTRGMTMPQAKAAKDAFNAGISASYGANSITRGQALDGSRSGREKIAGVGSFDQRDTVGVKLGEALPTDPMARANAIRNIQQGTGFSDQEVIDASGTKTNINARQIAQQEADAQRQQQIDKQLKEFNVDQTFINDYIKSSEQSSKYADIQAQISNKKALLAQAGSTAAREGQQRDINRLEGELRGIESAARDSIMQTERERLMNETRTATVSQRRIQGLATQGGGGFIRSADEVANILTRQGLEVDSRFIKENEDGTLEYTQESIVRDPFERAVKRQAEDVKTAKDDAREQYTEAEAAIRDQYTFKTGVRAGQLTEQGKRELSRLKAKRDKEFERIDRLSERGLEDIVLQEEARQQSILSQVEKEESPTQQESRIKAQNFLDLHNDYILQGYDSKTATAMAERDLKEWGDEGIANYNKAKLFLSAETTQGMSLGNQYQQLRKTYNLDGEETFDIMKKFYSPEIAKKAQEEFYSSIGYGEKQITIETFKSTINDLYSGEAQEAGSVGQFIEDAEKANYPTSWIRGQLEVIANGIDTDPKVKEMANFWLKEPKFKTSTEAATLKTIGNKIISIDPVTMQSRVIFESEEGDTPEITREKAKDTFSYRKDIQSQSKAFLDARDSYETLLSARESARTDKTGASDQAMVFSFMKTLDPGSVVREGEFAQAAKNAGLGSQIVNMFDRVDKGKILTDEQRDAMLNVGVNIYNKKVQNQKFMLNEAREVATRLGYDPDVAVPDYFNEFEDKGKGLDNVTESSFGIDLSRYDTDFLRALPKLVPSGFDYEQLDQQAIDEFQELYNSSQPKFIDGVLQGESPIQGSIQEPVKDLIKQEEGFREEAYLDQAGIPTIGYGFTQIDGKPVQIGDTISREEAEQQLNKQITKYTKWKDKVTTSLTPQQEEALTSFSYNLGANIFDNPDGELIIDSINNKDFEEAARLMKLYVNFRDPETGELRPSNGLIARREREANKLLNSNV